MTAKSVQVICFHHLVCCT